MSEMALYITFSHCTKMMQKYSPPQKKKLMNPFMHFFKIFISKIIKLIRQIREICRFVLGGIPAFVDNIKVYIRKWKWKSFLICEEMLKYNSAASDNSWVTTYVILDPLMLY